MSTRLPKVVFGAPHYHITVTIHPTGDPEIDAGVEGVLSRQGGVKAVSSRPGPHGTVQYDVVVDSEYSNGVGLIVKLSAEAVETYYLSWGMDSAVHAYP